jgi:hypothetical protein
MNIVQKDVFDLIVNFRYILGYDRRRRSSSRLVNSHLLQVIRLSNLP